MKKNRFTPTELKTLHNTRFFEVKAAATKKIDILFSEVRDSIKAEIIKNKITFPTEVDVTHGKIFRGENYLGLPYLVLDYPKHFSKESVYAFRTMFWWGNFFSFTLHLQGKALEGKRSDLIKKIPLFKKNVFICINDNPWQYHYKKKNYVPINKLSNRDLKKIILKKDFIKLSGKIPLKDHKKLTAFCIDNFRLFA